MSILKDVANASDITAEVCQLMIATKNTYNYFSHPQDFHFLGLIAGHLVLMDVGFQGGKEISKINTLIFSFLAMIVFKYWDDFGYAVGLESQEVRESVSASLTSFSFFALGRTCDAISDTLDRINEHMPWRELA